MINYHVVKIGFENSEFTYTTLGYINPSDKDAFETIHGFPLKDWSDNNPEETPEEYFVDNSPYYLRYSQETSGFTLDGFDLITDLNNPEA